MVCGWRDRKTSTKCNRYSATRFDGVVVADYLRPQPLSRDPRGPCTSSGSPGFRSPSERTLVSREVLCRAAPRVAIVEPTQAGERNQCCVGGRLWLDWPPMRRILAQRIVTKTSAVPSDDGLRLHDDEDVSPAGPTAAQGRPEEPVGGVQGRSGAFPFEDRDLLSEGEDFEGGVASTAEENTNGGEE